MSIHPTPRRCALASTLVITVIATGLSACAEGRPVEESAGAGIARGPPLCRRCSISPRPIAHLGDAEGPGILEGEFAGVTVDGRGRFLLWQPYRPWVKVFGPDGRYLATVGREGAGPGEFRGVGFVQVTGGDTIHVLDNTLARHSIFSPELVFVRAHAMEVAPEIAAVVLSGDRVVLPRAGIPAPGTDGHPLHRFDAGRRTGGFGADSVASDPARPFLGDRAIAPASDGRLWTAHRHQYLVELREADGTLSRQLRRQVDWFRPVARPSSVAPDEEPTPRLSELRQEGDRLWVSVSVAAAGWRDAVRSGGPHGFTLDPDLPYRDQRIEVIDWRRGRVLVSHRLPGFLQLIGRDMAGRVEADDEGIPRFTVYRLEIDDPDGELPRR